MLYHSIARNNNLSIKISNDTLIDMTFHALFLHVLESNFKINHHFEIVEVQKNTPHNHAYIVTPTPTKPRKFKLFKYLHCTKFLMDKWKNAPLSP